MLGIVAAAIGFAGYALYIRDTIRGITKPHVFSWFVWGCMNVIAFSAQIVKGGGAGAWVTGVSAMIVFLIAGLALKYKNWRIHVTDWIAFLGALLGTAAWAITREPFLAILFVTVADALGFFPTLRKAYDRPHDETLTQFVCSAFKWTIALLALEAWNPTT